MPNWTSNRITIEGEPQDIHDFLDAVRSQEQLFDFHKIIPMPELLRKTGVGYTAIGGKTARSWYVVREATPGAPEEIRAFTPEEKAALRDIGYFNWYDWSVVNWGTKWHAFHSRIDGGDSIERGHVEITFDTAWEAPIPIFRKIIASFPKLTFDCRWRNEDDLAIDVGDDPYPHMLGKSPAGEL